MRVLPLKVFGPLTVAMLATLSSGTVGAAPGAPGLSVRSLAFPASLASGVTGDLVVPPGSASVFTFQAGKVAVGDLPVPIPEAAAPRRRGHNAGQFLTAFGGRPSLRFFLSGIVDGNGNRVSVSGSQLIIDAVVSPSSAATSGPPFVFPFEISDGLAALDAALPLEARPDGVVRLQILGVTLTDPDGQPFGVLGFEMPAARPTNAARPTPTPTMTPAAGAALGATPTPCAGQCFDTVAMRCTGQPCGPGSRCLPNEVCDGSGQRCPCAQRPPAPAGHVCCHCKDRVPACFDFSFVEAPAICPPGCDTVIGAECDGSANACVPLKACGGDRECDDGNGCTIDRCTASGCTHDCVCVGVAPCGGGPR